MKLLANRKIRVLFLEILGCCLVWILATAFIPFFLHENITFILLLVALGVTAAILYFVYCYFREQNQMLEEAAGQITEYISGNRDARIECNEEGELYHLFHDVNSLVAILNAQTEDEIRTREFLKDTIADISHQLKTPLAALNIYNGIMQDAPADVKTIEKFAGLSEQELDRIETLVQNLLKITKLDAGTITIDKSLENVGEILEGVRKHFAYRAEQEGKEIRLSGEDAVFLLCDRNWLSEAIDNIVKNALDHTGSGDSIAITWKQFASVVQVTIKDNGQGIHSEDIHYIFKRFYRSKFSKETQGVGLGLPLAKAIIEAHNGTIEVDSELGKGTTFIINFLIPTNL